MCNLIFNFPLNRVKTVLQIRRGKRDNFGSISHISTYKHTVKILKIGTPEIITIIVLHLEQLDFTVQYCVQKMQTE